MTSRLPLLPSGGQKGVSTDPNATSSRLLIVCPLADIYSGVG